MVSSTSQIIIWIITFFFFTIEAIIHYNLGKSASKDSDTIENNNKNVWKLLQIPPLEEMKKIAVIVGTVSILSTITINFIGNKYKF